MSGAYKVEQISDWFLAQDSMTPKKLQKLVYYAYAWYLAFNNEADVEVGQKLFDEEIEAWVHGPVIPKLYHEYKANKYHNIEKINQDEIPKFDEDTEDILNQVWKVYGEYNGNELESITHQEKPWLEAREGFGALDRCNVLLDDYTIKNYYLKRLVNG